MIHSIFHFIFNVTIVIMNILQLICLINILSYDFSKFEILEHLNKNWSYNLIKKIKIEYQPPSEYISNKIEPLINISFPGIYQGCDCSLYNEKIYRGKCTEDLINKNCYDIEPIETIFLNEIYLKEINSLNNKGINIYLERYENLSYIDLLNNTNDFFIGEKNKGCNCNNNYKICFDCGIIDSLGNHLCITSSKGLESNCFKIKLEYDYSLKNTLLIKDFKNLKNISNYPIEFMTLFNSNKVCILQDESISDINIDYNLIVKNNITTLFNSGLKNGGCVSNIFLNIKNDYRWKKLNSLSLDYILDFNLKNELKKLPLFPYDDLLKKNITLVYRNFIGVYKRCIEKIKFIGEKMINYERTFKIKYVLYLFFSLIFFPSFLLFFMMISQIDILTFIQKFIFGLTFSSNVFIFLKGLYYDLIDLDKNFEKIKDIADNYCSDDLTNNLFFSILNDFNNLKNLVKFCGYWTVIMFLASICKNVLIVTKSFKRKIMLSLNFGNYTFINQVQMELIN